MRIRCRSILAVSAVCSLLVLSRSVRAADDVTITVNDQPAKVGVINRAEVKSLKISNGLLSMTFSTDDIGDLTATSMIKNGTELLHNLNGKEGRDAYRHRSFYIDWGGSAGTSLTQKVEIKRITPDLVEFVLIDDGTRPATPAPAAPASAPAAGRAGRGGRGGRGAGGAPTYLIDHHLIMRKGVSGLYGYVILRCPNGTQSNEIRTMYRFDRSIMDWAWNVERTGQQPTYAECDQMQANGDETWILPENSPYRQFTGAIYQKYDYCAYFSQSPMWGHYGHGFGAFYIPVSTEYYGSGPTRQDLIIHQDALILNYIQGGHFGAPTLRMNAGYEKMFGPWLVYIGANNDTKALIDDALKQVKAEQAAWPYQWVDDPMYQKDRTAVTGTLKISGGRSAKSAWVILAGPGGNIYGQMGGFMYYVKADENGKFTFPAVRPNTYSLYAWATEGPITGELEKDNIEVKGKTLELGNVDWDAPQRAQLLFQIGKPDHLAGEFKLGDSTRSKTRINEVPESLTYTVGKSKDNQDWYFAQRGGNWDVVFNVAKVPAAGGKGYLSLPMAGGGGTCVVTLNGQEVGRIQKRNDSTIGRDSVRGGTYQLNNLTFDGALLKPGDNVLRLSASGGGLMYDTVVLESD